MTIINNTDCNIEIPKGKQNNCHPYYTTSSNIGDRHKI